MYHRSTSGLGMHSYSNGVTTLVRHSQVVEVSYYSEDSHFRYGFFPYVYWLSNLFGIRSHQYHMRGEEDEACLFRCVK